MNEEHVFQAHEDEEAMTYLIELFQTAESELLIVDKYLDGILLSLISEIANPVKIKLLTGPSRIKSGFAKMITEQGQSNIACRIDNTGHYEKYIIIDGKDVYHLSGSFNALMKNGITVTKMDDAVIITEMKQLWSNASQLT